MNRVVYDPNLAYPYHNNKKKIIYLQFYVILDFVFNGPTFYYIFSL